MDTVTVRKLYSRLDCNPGCAIEAAMSLIDGKWKGVILYHLKTGGTLRFNEIRRRIPCLTQRTKVEYRLTPRGRSLEPVLVALQVWGEANLGLFAREPSSSKIEA